MKSSRQIAIDKDWYFEYKFSNIIKKQMDNWDCKKRHNLLFQSVKHWFISKEEFDFIMDFYFLINN